MAKKTAASAKPPKEPKAAKPSEVSPSISQQKLKALLASKRRATNDISEISGGLGSEIKTAIEENHLHRKAFGVICQLDRMEPEKLADFLDCFDHYLDISGLSDRAEQVQRLGLDGNAGDTEQEEGDEDDNVRRFPAAAE